jgi:hypothetical protein
VTYRGLAGNQYNANVTDRDPINDTPYPTPYFILVEYTLTRVYTNSGG